MDRYYEHLWRIEARMLDEFKGPLSKTDRPFRGGKNVTILDLPCLSTGLHIVCPEDSQRYYLLFTRIHKLFALLFTSIRTLLKSLTPPSPP